MLAAESVHDVVRLVRSPLACGSAVWPELWALERRCAADPLLARLARAEPDGAKTTGPAALARGLASIAGAANVANDRFPMPLPRGDSVAAYPKLAYEPRQATDIARAEFRRVAAAQSAQLRSEREAEEAELEEAVARREREALQRVEAAKAALVENSLVLAESRADDDFSAASSPQLLMPAAEPLDEAIARARSAVEELRD